MPVRFRQGHDSGLSGTVRKTMKFTKAIVFSSDEIRNSSEEELRGKLYSELTFPEPGHGLGHRVPSGPDCGIAVIMESDDIHYCR